MYAFTKDNAAYILFSLEFNEQTWWCHFSFVLTHSWEPCQAKHAAWPLLTQKLKYNSTKTGQDDETESRKTNKKEYIISNWSYTQTLVG